MSRSSAVGAHLFWPEARWRQMQAQRLRAHVLHAATSPLYQPHAAALRQAVADRAADADPAALLRDLPLTTKDALAAAGAAARAVAPSAVREWVCTSGTTGAPLDVPLTAGDLDRLAENEAVALAIAGLGRGDLFLLAVGMERLFVAGLAYHLGARALGAACVRVGPRMAAEPELLRHLATRLADARQRVFVIAVPSFLHEVAAPEEPLAGIIGIGEPTRCAAGAPTDLAARLSARFSCPVMSTYALTETCATFAEGPRCVGGHLNPTLATVEIIDPETGDVLADASGHDGATIGPGEVVITPLGVEGMPLLRFRTGDIACLTTAACACGRTTPRLGPILGRRQQLLKIRGTNVYPAAITEALRAIPAILDLCIVADRDPSLADRVTLHVHVAEETPALHAAIASRLRAVLRVAPEVRCVPRAALDALQTSTASRKPQRFIDRR